MTDEEACDVLVRHKKLIKEHGSIYNHSDTFAPHAYWMSAEQAISDGNVFAAAWEAVKRESGGKSPLFAVHTMPDQATIDVFDEKFEPAVTVLVGGTDIRAMTLACCKALTAMEQDDD